MALHSCGTKYHYSHDRELRLLGDGLGCDCKFWGYASELNQSQGAEANSARPASGQGREPGRWGRRVPPAPSSGPGWLREPGGRAAGRDRVGPQPAQRRSRRQRERGARPRRSRPRRRGKAGAESSIPDTGPAPPLGCSARPPAAASGSPSPPLPRCPLAARTPRARWGGEPEPELPALALAGPLTLLRPARRYRFCPRRPPALRRQAPWPRRTLCVPQLPAQHVGTRVPNAALGAEGAVRAASAPPWPRLLTGQAPSWKLHPPFPILASPTLRAAHARGFSRLQARGLALAGPGGHPAGRAPGASFGLRTRRGPMGQASRLRARPGVASLSP